MADTAKINIGDKAVEMPILSGTLGPQVVDIRKLYAGADVFTYDPGFTSTASCESKITFIDGDEGVLLHRGYPIDELAEKSSFLEVCYLLLHGELPTASQYRVRPQHHLPHDAARAVRPVLPGVPARRSPDGDHGGRGRRAVGLLP